jgi:predicted metal-binding protein
MTAIGLFRCQENETKCPLTNCFRSLLSREQAFSGYERTELAGVFTLQDDLAATLDLAKILKSKGAEAIHIPTCAFAHKGEGKTWHLGHGFVPNVDDLCTAIAKESGLPCVKGSAHLPEGYTPQVFQP